MAVSKTQLQNKMILEPLPTTYNQSDFKNKLKFFTLICIFALGFYQFFNLKRNYALNFRLEISDLMGDTTVFDIICYKIIYTDQ